jgi:hypothetical protein
MVAKGILVFFERRYWFLPLFHANNAKYWEKKAHLFPGVLRKGPLVKFRTITS